MSLHGAWFARTALAATLLCAGAARAQEILAARVNGVGITAARLDRYVDEFLAESGRSAGAIRNPDAYASLRRQALDRLVDAELLWQEASRLHLVASDEQVDAAMAQFRGMHRSDLSMQLKLEEAGFTPRTYREYLRQQISIRMLVDRIARSVKVAKSEAELRVQKTAEAVQQRIAKLRESGKVEYADGR